MKVAIVCYPTHGGSGVVASELALELAKQGHEIHILSYATPFRLRSFHQNVFVHEVQMATYPLFKYPPYALGLATKLVEIAEEYHIEIIHAHYAVPHAASAYLAQKILMPRRVKTITTLHGTDITLVGADKSFHRVVKFAIEQSDGVTAVSNYLRDKTIEEFNIQKEIRVIYNFVDSHSCRRKIETCIKDQYAPKGEKILIHASNFRPVKRVGDVVRIFQKVQQQIPSKLVLIGEGPERIFVQQLVKEYKLMEHVHFIGEQDYIEPLLGCADLFVLPSEQESFGLVALEAQSCSVPVIATKVGGLSEVIIDNETGFLLPVGETALMAKKAIELLTNSELHKKFRMNARERAVKNFDQRLIIPQYENYYTEILNSK